MESKAQQESQEFDSAVLTFENEFVNFGSRFIGDSKVRDRYNRLIRDSASKMRSMAKATGNYAEAARLANEFRNEALNLSRKASSDVGRAAAFFVKEKGIPLNVLIENASLKTFSRSFDSLTHPNQIRQVYLQVIESSGRSNSTVNSVARSLGVTGRSFLVATVGIAIYDVATSKNKAQAVARQGTSIALGSALSIAGGWAGTFCGPGAVVCVPLGVFIGGALGAIAADQIY